MTLIFDFDGTIANTLDLVLDIYNQHITKEFACKPFDKSKLEDFKKLRPREFLKKFGVTTVKLPFIVLRTKMLLKRYINRAEPFAGIVEMLQHLQERKVNMGIVTSNTKGNVELFLNQHGLQDYFSFIRSSKSLISKKRSLEKVIARNKLKKEDIMYVGDEIRDIVSSQAANIRCIAVTWGQQHRSLLEQQNPDLVVEHPLEILELIDNRTLVKM